MMKSLILIFPTKKEDFFLSAYIQISLNSHATDTFDKRQAQIHRPPVMRQLLGMNPSPSFIYLLPLYHRSHENSQNARRVHIGYTRGMGL